MVSSYHRTLLDEDVEKLKLKLFNDRTKKVNHEALEYYVNKLVYELTGKHQYLQLEQYNGHHTDK